VVPHDLVLMAKVLVVALAVGLDVLAVSVGRAVRVGHPGESVGQHRDGERTNPSL
jgi:hypothetical protein